MSDAIDQLTEKEKETLRLIGMLAITLGGIVITLGLLAAP